MLRSTSSKWSFPGHHFDQIMEPAAQREGQLRLLRFLPVFMHTIENSRNPRKCATFHFPEWQDLFFNDPHLFSIHPAPLTRRPISGCDNRSKLPSLKMGKCSVSVPFCCLPWDSSLHLSHWKIFFSLLHVDRGVCSNWLPPAGHMKHCMAFAYSPVSSLALKRRLNVMVDVAVIVFLACNLERTHLISLLVYFVIDLAEEKSNHESEGS